MNPLCAIFKISQPIDFQGRVALHFDVVILYNQNHGVRLIWKTYKLWRDGFQCRLFISQSTFTSFQSHLFRLVLFIFYPPLFGLVCLRSTTMPPFTTAERIRAVEGIIGYEFQEKSLLLKALEAAGATAASQGNKRLALIGDAALRLVLYEFGYEDQATICETPQYLLLHSMFG